MDGPSQAELQAFAHACGFSLSTADLEAIGRLCASFASSYDRIDALDMDDPEPPTDRSRGRPPTHDENPFNAWAWICEIRESDLGPLLGERIGIKDNIGVAGIPLQNGSRILAGYVAQQDATVVKRILRAGGVVAGKTVCEDLCFSGGSHTSHPAAVLNPFDTKRSAGGSSSGNAVAIAAGDLAMCIGGDQGGSVRTPASFCGVVGLKPTYGLVPYTGAFAIEPTLDHLGPMGRSVQDVARLLAVIAGSDGCDPRQSAVHVEDYLGALRQSVAGLRIGVIREGFGRPESLEATDATVRRALKELSRHGNSTEEISIPWHIDGYYLAAPIGLEGAAEFMFHGNTMGFGLQGHYDEGMSSYWATGWRNHPDHLPDIAKVALLLNLHMRATQGSRYYRRAQNLRGKLRDAYDEALRRYDVLALPTTPMTATELPAVGHGFAEGVEAGLNMEGNTTPFDLSGHPAISVPCGLANGLPVGLMFIGRHFEDATVLRAAAALERLGDWKRF